MTAKKFNYTIFLTVLVCFLYSLSVFAQYTIPKKPDFQTSVYDYATILSKTEKEQLEEKLIKYSASYKMGSNMGNWRYRKGRQWCNHPFSKRRTKNRNQSRLWA